jgi:NADPH:quinone reductase-like Zn-dependent oxidoreductase
VSLAERKTSELGRTVAARGLRLTEKAEEVAAIRFSIETRELRRERPDQVIVEVRSAGVNPSDAKAALGAMPHAVWPRTPGRDFAGVVIEGPDALLGREVWGSGGELGIRRDGTHATHVLLDAASVRPKPKAVPLLEAGGIGVPFITALEGFHRAGMPRAGDTVLIMGLNGKVGQAAAQIAAATGARVIGVVRRAEPYAGHASAPVDVIDASSTDVAARVRELTGGKGADIVYNTVGSPYFEAAHKSLAVLGRQILIATIEKSVPFDIFEFYRGRHTYVGVDTLALDSRACAAYLDELAPGFESGKLKPFPVEGGVYGFADAKRAYAQVLGSTRPRVVIVPDA